MITILSITEFLETHKSAPILDVRSAGEYEHGHLLGSISMPLFTDEERSVIGTLYKHDGREKAIEKGLEYVGPRMADMVRRARQITADGNQIKLYCWRGGMRSNSVAWLLHTAGMHVIVLEGGYKSYRRHVLHYLNQSFQFNVLGGYTGSGKTEILKAMQQSGAQVVDLESLANHRGSAFGALCMPAQPSTEMFENKLYQHLIQLNPQKPIWIEDESKNIGKVFLPHNIHASLKSSQTYFIICDAEKRREHLLSLYGEASIHEIQDALERIKKRLGNEAYQSGCDMLKSKKLDQFCEIVLRYYDRSYEGLISKRSAEKVIKIDIPSHWTHNDVAQHLLSQYT